MNMTATASERLLIVVYGTRDPTVADWQWFLKFIEGHGVVKTQHLIYTDGGAPSFAQRRQLRALIAGRRVPTAVVCDSFRVRVVLTVLSWIDSSIKPFPPSGLVDALEFLEVPMSRFGLITREVEKLRRKLEQEYDA